jgi:hypothetical protein
MLPAKSIDLATVQLASLANGEGHTAAIDTLFRS